jgi:hypothetical protein
VHHTVLLLSHQHVTCYCLLIASAATLAVKSASILCIYHGGRPGCPLPVVVLILLLQRVGAVCQHRRCSCWARAWCSLQPGWCSATSSWTSASITPAEGMASPLAARSAWKALAAALRFAIWPLWAAIFAALRCALGRRLPTCT